MSEASMSRFKPQLTDAQRWNLAEACLANSADLLSDSEVLIRSDRLARGTFLLLVAFEEMLKARYCMRSRSAPWPNWWRGFRNHETKLDEARSLAPEAPADMIRIFTRLRERCLYADVKSNGDPLTPRGLVDPGELDGRILLGWATTIRDEGKKTVEELAASRPKPVDD